MNADAKEDGLPPLLRLHNWGNFPLPISLFHTASLAPSRTNLLLLSHRHEALLVPLGPSNSNTLPNQTSSPSSSESLPDLATKPKSLASPIPTLTPEKSPRQRFSEERSESDSVRVVVPDLWSPPAFSVNSEAPTTPPSLIARRRFAQVHGHPGFENLTTPTYTPSSTPLFSFSPSSSRHSPALSPSWRLPPLPSPLAVSSGLTFPSPFPFLSDIECFTWACCGDDYAANQGPGPFRELLLTGGKEGLIIHAFCIKEGIQDRATLQTTEVHPQPDLGSGQSGGGLPNGKRTGRWRNWGLTEFKRRQECWRRLEEAAAPSQGKEKESNQIDVWRIGRVNLESASSLGVPRPKPLEDFKPRRAFSQGATRTESARYSEESTGFESFVVDAKLEGSEQEASLQYDKHHLWPNSAEVVSFRIAHDSAAFLRLVSLAQKSEGNGPVEEDVLPSERDDGSTSTSSGPGPTRMEDGNPSIKTHRGKGGYEVTGILSNPSQNVVALMLASFSPVLPTDLSEGIVGSRAPQTPESSNDCNGHKPDGGRWRRTWKGSSDICIIIATVHSWGMKWTSRIDFESAGKEKRVPNSPWADFKLSNEKFLGLTESGCVYMWAATTGQFVACIDVPQYCGFTFGSTKRTSNQINVEGSGGLGDLGNQMLTEELGDEYSKETKGGEAKTIAKSLKIEKTHKFVQVLVTSDCLLIAITNEQGLVFLVSVEDYFLAHPQPLCTDLSSSKGSSQCNLRVLSSWEVAGSYIGGAASIKSLPKHQVAKMLSEQKLRVERNKVGTNSIPHKDHSLYPVSIGASGFTPRVIYNNQITKPLNVLDNPPKPLRKVFLPLRPSDSFVGMALNPYGITRVAINIENASEFILVQNELRISGGPFDEAKLGSRELLAIQESVIKQHRYEGEVLSFSSQGCLYLVTATALHVVLPPLALSSPQSDALALGCEGPWWPTGSGSENFASKWDGMLPLLTRPRVQQWQSEVQDRSLVFDGFEEAERLCAENGWNLQLLRLRRLQLALDYLQIDEIEQALEGLVNVGAAEAGMPRVLFAAVELMLTRFGTDNELVLASRLLALAAQFSTRLVRRHGMAGARLQRRKSIGTSASSSSSQFLHEQVKSRMPSGMTELARFLEVIRTLQEHLQAKRKGRNRSFKGRREASLASNSGSFKNRPIVELPNETSTADSSDSSGHNEQANVSTGTTESPFSISQGALVTAPGSSGARTTWDQGSLEEAKGRRSSLESAGEMFARWENTSVDAESVVRDALRAGRVPLAVVQLHRMRSRACLNSAQGLQPEMVDVFQEVQEIGKGIVYELLCKGKMALAMAALRRLGEDIEVALHELAFGSVRRSLRKQAKMELHRHVHLGTLDSQLLDITSYLEGLYPHSSFWITYVARQSQITTNKTIIEPVTSDDEKQNLRLVCDAKVGREFVLECGDVDGVVLGSWNTATRPEAAEETGLGQDNPTPGYLVVAVVWLHAWNQRTINRVILDRSLIAGEHTSWGAQLEYHLSHHNWPEVSTLLDTIPHSVLYGGELRVFLDSDNALNATHTYSGQPVERRSYTLSRQEVLIPKVNLLRIDAWPLCSGWMFRMMEEKLGKNLIFLRPYWKGTTEVVSILASASVLFKSSGDKGERGKSKELVITTRGVGGTHTPFQFHKEAVQGVHELVVRHCLKLSLVNMLERYLSHHALGLNKTSAALMQSYVGDCEWARWLLLSRLKGREYDASFANARSISKANSMYKTVDDMAADGKGIMALTTLLYAPQPLQKCLSIDTRAEGQDGPTWQCSFQNLREHLQGYPTLWQTLVAVSHGHDAWGFYSSRSPDSEETSRGLSSYLQWRRTLFTSVAGDASLLHILPRWLPKSVQKLLQLALKGPGGGSQATLNRGSEFPVGTTANRDPDSEAEFEDDSVLEWEASIQAVIKQDLHAPAAEEIEPGVEHYLRRGRALAAFNALLSPRVHFLEAQSEGSPLPDFQALLASLTESEEAVIASVYPLAISNFENTIVVAACALFLELCGLSAQILRVDIAALQRIAKYLRVQDQRDWASSTSIKKTQEKSTLVPTLARALTDEYTTSNMRNSTSQPTKSSTERNKALTTTLQMLEKATLMEYGSKPADGTSGSWLQNARGNGAELRELQRSLSERWSLVTAFCRGHNLPLSTTYLAQLARDNDWVGFLAEAQVMGCPLDVLLTLASRDFTDPRLQCHLVTVLKSMPAATQPTPRPEFQEVSSSGFGMEISGELFALLAEYESHKSPGTELLNKSKELRWPLLAVVASCFDDVEAVSCLTIWLEITAARETSGVPVNDDTEAQITATVGAAVEATNAAPNNALEVPFDRKYPKRQRCGQSEDSATVESDEKVGLEDGITEEIPFSTAPIPRNLVTKRTQGLVRGVVQRAVDMAATEKSLAALVAVLCEQQLFLPLLQAFELFTPTSSILSFIRFLQAFAQMRLTEASAQLASFSALLKEETNKNAKGTLSWITKTAVAAAEAMLEACPSVYERRCLLQLLSAVDFCDSGIAALKFRRYYWKLQLVEPSLRGGRETVTNGPNLGDEELLESLEASGQWDEGRSWARQLDLGGHRTSSAIHHVTETQAEAMVAEWKELLWDVEEERAALWGHCQALFTRHSFPPLQAGTFFLRHADAVEGNVSTMELHSILLLAFQWLSGSFTDSSPMYPIHLLHELEIRIWLLAVEAEVEMQDGHDKGSAGVPASGHPPTPPSVSPVDSTANTVAVVDMHLKNINMKNRNEASLDSTNTASSTIRSGHSSSPHKMRHRHKHLKHTSSGTAPVEASTDADQRNWNGDAGAEGAAHNQDDGVTRSGSLEGNRRLKYTKYSSGGASSSESSNDLDTEKENRREGADARTRTQLDGGTQRRTHSGSWEERIGEGEVERAVLALVEVGQVSAAKQLQQKLSPAYVPLELLLVGDAQRLAMLSVPEVEESVIMGLLHPRVLESVGTTKLTTRSSTGNILQVLNALTEACRDGCGQGLCRRIAAVAQISHFLGIQFAEAFDKYPLQLLQLLSLKGHEALTVATLLVTTHSMAAPAIARILSETFYKGLLAAYRGGYSELEETEEGPGPLLWRVCDFKEWAQLCPSEPEIGHALMRLVISAREIPHACEVDLLILAHQYYESSGCLDGLDVLVGLAATRVDAYVAEADFVSLTRLAIGLSNLQALRFILDILIENGQLDLLLQKTATLDLVDGDRKSKCAVQGFHMGILSSLNHFNPHDQDAFALVYNQFNMQYEMAGLMKARAEHGVEWWVKRRDPELSEELLDTMRLFMEAAELYSGIDAGYSTSWCCAQASMVSLQLRMPELMWLNLTETNARRLLVEQPRFPEALIVAEAYSLNQSAEWVPVLWNQMLQSGRIDHFLNKFVAVLPLPATMLMELARFYRAEVSARGYQMDFTKWLTPGAVPMELSRHLGKSMRSLLKQVWDIRVRVQLATVATGFPEVVDSCIEMLDKVPETAGPLILRKGHGGAYVPLM